MKVEVCEIISVVCVAILPLAIVGTLVYEYGHPLDNGLMAVALLIFIAIVILWMAARVCKAKGDNKNGVDIDPEAIVEEIATKAPSSRDQTPIFTPLTIDMLNGRPTSIASLPTPIHSQTPANTQCNASSHIYTFPEAQPRHMYNMNPRAMYNMNLQSQSHLQNAIFPDESLNETGNWMPSR